jgi:lipid-binding SYLF domain-containing protein
MVVAALLAAPALAGGTATWAASAQEINAGGSAALAALYAKSPEASSLRRRAQAILIFPKIVKAGFVFGAQGGEGVLEKQGQPVAYYRTVGGSYGLQAGVQTYSYALFLMTPSAVAYLDQNHGLEVGVGPSIVVVNSGAGKNITTTTTKKEIYAFIFGQSGLMAGVGLQGVKITRINK